MPFCAALGLHLDASAGRGLAPLSSQPQWRVLVQSADVFLSVAPGAAIACLVPTYYQHVALCAAAAPPVAHCSHLLLLPNPYRLEPATSRVIPPSPATAAQFSLSQWSRKSLLGCDWTVLFNGDYSGGLKSRQKQSRKAHMHGEVINACKSGSERFDGLH
jgi:hypothetical protein